MGLQIVNLAFVVWFFVVLFITGLFINVLQFFTLPFFWIHRNTYHIVINKLSYVLLAHLTFLAEWWGHFELKLYCDDDKDILHIKKDKSIVLFNHYSDLDWLGAYVFVERINCLGIEQVLMKSFCKYLPVLGWNWWFGSYGFMQRDWTKDKESLRKMTDGCKASDIPYIFTICPESTRRTPEKLKASQEYAILKDLHPLNHHLIPRTKGFAFIASQLKDDLQAIYDAEFAFPDTENSTLSALLQRGTVVAHFYLRRIPISVTKLDNEDVAAGYLMDLFEVKDNIMEYFEQHGNFEATEIKLPRRKNNLLIFTISSLFAGCFLSFAVYSALLVYSLESFLFVSLLVSTVMAVSVMVGIRITSTKKGSSFGLKDKKAN